MANNITKEFDSSEAKSPPREDSHNNKDISPKGITYSNFKPYKPSLYGNSIVFSALRNGERVIIKTLKKELRDNPGALWSFRKEYEITQSLDSRYIRKALGYASIEELGECIIFEYVDGNTLAEHIRVGSLSKKEIIEVLTEVCEALNYLHRNKVIHCDLKPENILIDKNNKQVKLIDIGHKETDYKAIKNVYANELQFTAPELIAGNSVDARCDIYSIGKIMEFIQTRGLAGQLTPIVKKCTQHAREQRYSDINDVKNALNKGHFSSKVLVFVVLIAIAVGLYFVFPLLEQKYQEYQQNKIAQKNETILLDIKRELLSEVPNLCDKYRYNSIDAPLYLTWEDDSLRLRNKIQPYVFNKESQDIADAVILEIYDTIKAQRAKEFNSIVVDEFLLATDTTALRLQNNGISSDTLLLKQALEWFRLTHNF